MTAYVYNNRWPLASRIYFETANLASYTLRT